MSLSLAQRSNTALNTSIELLCHGSIGSLQIVQQLLDLRFEQLLPVDKLGKPFEKRALFQLPAFDQPSIARK